MSAAYWVGLDYGPNLIATFEIGGVGKTKPDANFAYKGIAIRLDAGPGGVSRGNVWMMFDHDTMRLAAAWSGPGFINWRGINFDGSHGTHPRLVGNVHFANPVGPGWANPENDRFDDPRLRGRDDKPYGPLPRGWAHYKGLYHFGQRVIVSYTVGKASILETPGYELDSARNQAMVFTRTLNIGKTPLGYICKFPATPAWSARSPRHDIRRRPSSREACRPRPGSFSRASTSSSIGGPDAASAAASVETSIAATCRISS